MALQQYDYRSFVTFDIGTEILTCCGTMNALQTLDELLGFGGLIFTLCRYNSVDHITKSCKVNYTHISFEVLIEDVL